ncbi:MAG: rhomboid family intramembrane serine protease [Verrucomicrobia bacterium]|jgi:membrane associated rhomboid family serine protease|nr:rhomboid family intramembrane serine protease [Verrucomicrobiota bacterium]
MFTDDPAEQDAAGTLPVTGKRQAMDWSLVLLSQGIESVVQHEPETGQWWLEVPSGQRTQATACLQRYERENRFWPFRQALPWPGFAFDWTVLAWVGLISAVFALQTQPGSVIEPAGIFNIGLVRSGEWWRALTATTLHTDLGHLAMNSVFGILLLGIAMGRFGFGLTLLTTMVCGFLANVVTVLWREDRVSGLGASGVVMAALGLLAADATVQYWRRKQPPRLIAEGVAAGLMLFVLVGVSPTSDVATHTAGILGGLLLGLPLANLPLTIIRRPLWNLVAGLAYCAMMSLAWMRALLGQGSPP